MTLLFGNRSPWRLFLSKDVFEGGRSSPFPLFRTFRPPPFNAHRFLRANTRGEKRARAGIGRNWGGASSNWVIDVSF